MYKCLYLRACVCVLVCACICLSVCVCVCVSVGLFLMFVCYDNVSQHCLCLCV